MFMGAIGSVAAHQGIPWLPAVATVTPTCADKDDSFSRFLDWQTLLAAAGYTDRKTVCDVDRSDRSRSITHQGRA